MKSKIMAYGFTIILTGLFLINLIIPDEEFTISERRRLAEFPSFSISGLLSGEFCEKFNEYVVDQFFLRDLFRRIKAIGSYYLFKQKDNNGIYIIDENISKIEYPLNNKAVIQAVEKMNDIYMRYLSEKNVFYGVIPDKNYFLAKENGYLSMDYEKLLDILRKNLVNMKYIDLFSILKLEDYYRTDIHWRQENLLELADKILESMVGDVRIEKNQYVQRHWYPFYGALYGHSALNIEPDELIFLTNSVIENSLVYDYETNTTTRVYVPEKLCSVDSYDVFLSGAKPILRIVNEQADNDKELILFRDSFGSSIAPLFLSEYKSVILVDLRYISSDILGNYIDFSKKQDVLFLYNTQLLNHGYLLK
jgi:hypothetical protein